MAHNERSKGFSLVWIAFLLLTITAIGVGGWTIWQKNSKDTAAQSSKTAAKQAQVKEEKAVKTTESIDPTEGGKYLVIKEWNTRVVLPESLEGKVSYILDNSEEYKDPDTNLALQSASIYIESDELTANDCAVVDTSIGRSTTTVIQYIRSDSSEPFNSARYTKGTMKANILQDAKYAYHLNYITPDCIGSDSNTQKLAELQAALPHLKKSN